MSAPFLILNCEITKNNSEFGGCISSEFGSFPGIENCSISQNSSNTMGTIVTLGADSKTTIVNSIIWNNEAPKAIYGNALVRFSNIEGGYDGMGNISADPLFIPGPRGDYYLSQINSGQEVDSPCINMGRELPIDGYEPQCLTTRTDGLFDTDRCDMGYHYNPHIMFALRKDPEKENYTSEDNIKLLLDIETASLEQEVDIYFIMVNPSGETCFGMNWEHLVQPCFDGFTLPADLKVNDAVFLDITLPCSKPFIKDSGTYTFALAAFAPDTEDFLSNLAVVSFLIKYPGN